MVIYADLTTEPADLRAAAEAQGMTTTQFVAWATNNAVEDWKRREALFQALRDTVLDTPGGTRGLDNQ